MDGNIEINDDQDDNFVQTKRLNIQLTGLGGDFLSQSSARGYATHGKEGKLYGQAAKEHYLLSLQVVLQKQLKIIIKIFFNETSLDAELELLPVVKLFWLRNLQASLLPDNDKSELGQKEDENEEVDIDFNHPDLHLPTTLDLICIIYLSLLVLRYPVYVHDLVAALKQNTIPYMRCLHLLPRDYVKKLPSYYIKLFEPTKLPLSNEIYETIFKISSRVCPDLIQVPMDYYYPLAFKIISKTLLLPDAPEIFLLWVAITEKLQIPEIKLQEESKSKSKSKRRKTVANSKLLKFSELQVVALVILTIKVYFVYNTVGAECKIDPTTWLNNLTQYELNHEFPVPQSGIDEEDILNWSDKKINRYCQWIYANLVPKKNKTFNIIRDDHDLEEVGQEEMEELSMMDKRLFQIFNIGQEEYASSGKRTLDLENEKNQEDFSIDQVFSGYKPQIKKVLVSDINSVENHLTEKLSGEFGVTKKLLEMCYNGVEVLVLDVIKEGG